MSSLGLAAVLALAAHGAPIDTTRTSDESRIQRWIHNARERHPEALSATAQTQAARGELSGAKAWMPPNAQLQYQSDGRVDLSVSQMIPAPGKTAGQTQVRASRLEMARADSADRIRKLSLSIREAAWMEWMASQRAKIATEQETLAVRLSETVRRSQAQGMATASEAWIAQTKARQTHSDAVRILAEARSANAMRESWTGIDTALEADDAIAPDWNDSALSKASELRPDIASMTREADLESAMGQAMMANLRPDIMVGAMAMRMTNGMPGWGVMAGMTMPFVPWARGMATGDAAGAHARSRVAQNRAQTMIRMARAEVADHSAKAHAAWTAMRELDSLVLPGQAQAVADTRARYAQGHEMLAMVFAMEDMVSMARMEAVMRRGEYELERARLLAASGLESFEQVGVK